MGRAMHVQLTEGKEMQLGRISQRNQDGTSYLFVDGFGEGWTEEYSEATLVPESKLAELEARMEESRERDCPDNGFYGMYNLAWRAAQGVHHMKRNAPSYIITDSDRFFPVRLEGKVIATLSRPRVLDRDGEWQLTATDGTLVTTWPSRPMRYYVNAALQEAGLWEGK